MGDQGSYPSEEQRSNPASGSPQGNFPIRNKATVVPEMARY
jgi:hypothetical protein